MGKFEKLKKEVAMVAVRAHIMDPFGVYITSLYDHDT